MNVRNNPPPTSKATFWKLIILALALTINATLVSRLFSGPQSFISYRELAAQHEELTTELEEYDKANAALSREIRLLQSDEKYVEKMIRQRLNFVRNNEILYLFTDEQNTSGALSDDRKN